MNARESNRAKLVGAALLCVFYIAGAASAYFAMRQNRRSAPPPALAVFRSDVIERLGVTDAQRNQLIGILERGADEADEILQGAADRVDALAKSTTQELRAVLDPRQRSRLDSLLATEPEGGAFLRTRAEPPLR